MYVTTCTHTHNISLAQAAAQLTAQMVTAAAERGSVSEALDAQRTATGVVSAVTAEQIAKSPDGDAAAAVKRVRLLSNERSKAVRFVMCKDQVEITSSTPEVGEAHEVLPVEYSGGAMQICFNAQYVLDFLAVAATDVVALELKDEVSQAVMTPVGAEGYDYTYVIMPMRV